MNSRRVRHTLMLAALAAWSLSGQLRAQGQQGSVTGRVTDATTGLAVPSVQVTVLGTTSVTQTNDQGQYTLRGVHTGEAEVARASRRLRGTAAGCDGRRRADRRPSTSR